MANATETYSRSVRGFGLDGKCSIQTYVCELLALAASAIWEVLDPLGGSESLRCIAQLDLLCPLFPDLSRVRKQSRHYALTVTMGSTFKLSLNKSFLCHHVRA